VPQQTVATPPAGFLVAAHQHGAECYGRGGAGDVFGAVTQQQSAGVLCVVTGWSEYRNMQLSICRSCCWVPKHSCVCCRQRSH
jgi:hypothetical protein